MKLSGHNDGRYFKCDLGHAHPYKENGKPDSQRVVEFDDYTGRKIIRPTHSHPKPAPSRAVSTPARLYGAKLGIEATNNITDSTAMNLVVGGFAAYGGAKAGNEVARLATKIASKVTDSKLLQNVAAGAAVVATGQALQSVMGSDQSTKSGKSGSLVDKLLRF